MINEQYCQVKQKDFEKVLSVALIISGNRKNLKDKTSYNKERKKEGS